MAEKSAEGQLHEVDDAEADAVIEFASRAIPHNEMLGRVVRNMYKRIQQLEAQVKELQAKPKKAAAKAGGP
ncbi:MAG: hypothetical protein NWE93_01720 [Candidatus Bathyarchaeota archaeon]|nr:hypothetical protein [Candidatus Bathyarchaeota archaeon]